MHIFVKQYEKLQFDIDSEESYQEKRTALNGVVLKANLPIEVHASKVYTRTMFEQFVHSLFESGQYMLEEIEPRKSYIARHTRHVFRGKWRKTIYRLQVDEDKGEYKCECGSFEHSGMPCCHQIKVLLHLGHMEIPSSLVLKRWTRDARDILPPHLGSYQKDQGRHSNLSLTAFEIIRMGDSNPAAYELAMELMVDVKTRLEPLCATPDSLGVHKREQAELTRENAEVGIRDDINRGRAGSPGIGQETATTPGMGEACKSGMNAKNGSRVTMPSKKRPVGRPSNGREKAPYEEVSTRSRFCSVCRLSGHKSTTCPLGSDIPKVPRRQPKCSNCGSTGHQKNSCGNPKILLG